MPSANPLGSTASLTMNGAFWNAVEQFFLAVIRSFRLSMYKISHASLGARWMTRL